MSSSISSQYDKIYAVTNTLRWIADFVNDLSMVEREYDFEFLKIGDLIARINFDEIIQGPDSKLRHAVLPMVRLTQLIPPIERCLYFIV